MRNKLNYLFLLFILALFSPALPAPAAQAADYGQRQYWLSLPDKPAKGVDVFWVYPTVYQGKKHISDIGDAQMKRAAARTLQTQAAVFAGSADIYAPLYRQCGLEALKLSPEEKERALDAGFQDLQAALDYYLTHLNRGRPLILAGHSQGSNQLLKLLKKRLGDKKLRKILVAAYVIGWSVTSQDLVQYPHLRLCNTPRQTGCVISYNSVAEGYANAAPTIIRGAIAVNPLTWNTAPGQAPASANLGAVFVAADGSRKLVPRFTPARVEGGALMVEPKEPELLTQMPFGPGVYHAYDYSLFFENLRRNAAQRIEAFKKW